MSSKPTHIPNFRNQANNKINELTNSAKNSVNDIINGGVPNFSKIAEEKLTGILGKVENEDAIGKYAESLLSKLGSVNAGKNISKVAKALGIDVNEDMINNIFEKKRELSSVTTSTALTAVTKFMAKEGYEVETPDKIITDATSKLQNGDDPSGIFKEIAEPFSQLGSDTLNGKHSISLGNIGSSIKESYKESGVSSVASDLAKSIKDVYQSASNKTENTSDFSKYSEIMASIKEKGTKIEENIQQTKNKYIPNLSINGNIPDQIQSLIEKYNIKGGN